MRIDLKKLDSKINHDRGVLEAHITNAINLARHDGITGMSLSNLKQITPTRGMQTSPAMIVFDALFESAAKSVAARLNFPIWNR